MLRIVPITVKRALPWVTEHHSHLDKPNGGILAAAVAERGQDGCERLVCVAIADHPARMLMDGFTLNVSRVCSDGSTPHAASKCLAAISRAALALGCLRLVSYLLVGEHGTSYRAAGWWPTAISTGGEWDRPSRARGGGYAAW